MLTSMPELERLRAAYEDAISALRYIRLRYGDLYGVGWARLDDTYKEVVDDVFSTAVVDEPEKER